VGETWRFGEITRPYVDRHGCAAVVSGQTPTPEADLTQPSFDSLSRQSHGSQESLLRASEQPLHVYRTTNVLQLSAITYFPCSGLAFSSPTPSVDREFAHGRLIRRKPAQIRGKYANAGVGGDLTLGICSVDAVG
jgi:hypothetical protein